MFFIEWWLVRRFCFGLLMVPVAALGFWAIRKKALIVRLPVQLISVPVALLGVLFALLTWQASGCQSYSVAIYSPNGKVAARVRTDDEGGLGGNTHVELFTAHGLLTDEVYWGLIGSVDAENLHWKTDSDLEILYRGTAYGCTDAFQIKVHCSNLGPR